MIPFLVVILGVAGAGGGEPYYLPDEVDGCLATQEGVSLDSELNPAYLRGDFDGDKIPDHVLRIVDSKGGFELLACWGSGQSEVIRAVSVEERPPGMASFSFDGWAVFERRRIGFEATEELKDAVDGDAIELVWAEEASGLLYWSKRKPKWFHFGD